MQYLLAANSINIIAGEFNYDLLEVTENKLLDIFTDHVQIVNKRVYISGYMIDHICIKKTLMSIYFSDHDTLRIVIEKNAVDFYINL